MTVWWPSAPVTAHAARFLEAAVTAGLNVLVSGGAQAGNTTVVGCLGSAAGSGATLRLTGVVGTGGAPRGRWACLISCVRGVA